MAGKAKIWIPAARDRDHIAGDGLAPTRGLDRRCANASAAFSADDRTTGQDAPGKAGPDSIGDGRASIDDHGDIDAVGV
jgi:hypothetical protein